MKLTDLDPRWIEHDGRRVGFAFLSPANSTRLKSDGTPNPTIYRQTCFVEKLSMKAQRDLFNQMFGEGSCIQGCNPDCEWTVTGGIEVATFDTMTVTPSLDGSAGGLWHGFITNGVIS